MFHDMFSSLFIGPDLDGRSARVLPRMGQATPASRCEPTFRSSETPALLRP